MVSIESLKTIGSFEFDAGPLGSLRLSTQTPQFRQWLERDQNALDLDSPDLESQTPDTDAQATETQNADTRNDQPAAARFVRDLLTSQARRAAGDEPLEAGDVASVSEPDLETIADAIFSASGDLFRPRYTAQARSGRGRARLRNDDERYAMDRAPDETACGRLRRVMLAWREDRTLARQSLADAASRTGRSIAAALGPTEAAAASLSRRIAEMTLPGQELARRMSSLSAPSDAIRAAVEAARAPALQPTLELARSLALRDDLAKMVKIASPALEAQRRFEEQTRGLRAALAGVPDFGREFTGAARALQNALSGLTGPDARIDELVANSRRLLADQEHFSRLVQNQITSRFSQIADSALSATAGREGPFAAAAQAIRPSGFQFAAIVGLEQPLLRGVAADVLEHYAEENADAPVFSAATRQAALVDEAAEAAEVVSALQRFFDVCARLIRHERDIVRKNGLLHMLIFALTLQTAYLDWRQTTLAERQTELAKQSALPNPQLADILQETRNFRSIVESERDARQLQEKIRYVHARAPLRTDPSGKAQLMRFIYPDQILRMIDAKGDWALVEVVDYATDAVTKGWINRKHVRLAPLR